MGMDCGEIKHASFRWDYGITRAGKQDSDVIVGHDHKWKKPMSPPSSLGFNWHILRGEPTCNWSSSHKFKELSDGRDCRRGVCSSIVL